MNDDFNEFTPVIWVVLIVAAMLFILAALNGSRLNDISKKCREAGGQVVDMRGGGMCFRDGLMIDHWRN